jgi:hypothetical protein
MKAAAIINAIEGVTKKWTRQRKAEERAHSASLRRYQAMTRRSRVTIKDVAWEVMEEAYLKASAGGTLPANARQIMYAARPAIQEATGQALDDNYFTQTLLPDYIEARGVTWDVVFDARGRLTEPHTREEVPLWTLQVRDYLAAVENHTVPRLSFDVSGDGYPTCGPKNRYGAILFIEKEGFGPLFGKVKLAQRYDLAIMSTKGMSVTACRELVQALCAQHDIPLLVLHDFDVSGFSIFGTLSTSTRRFKFSKPFTAIDLGLRLADVAGLESEDVAIKSPQKTRETLRKHGATDEEVNFLLRRRVELNAFTSRNLIAWIERKLDQHGVAKIVPDDDTLVAAYRRMCRKADVQARIDEALRSLEADEAIPVPVHLRDRLTKKLEANHQIGWDAALLRVVSEDRLLAREPGGSA